MRRLPAILRILAVAFVVVAVVTSARAQGSAAKTGAPAEFGEVFPLSTFENANQGVAGPPKIDLKESVGKKPVVFCYFLVGETASELTLIRLQRMVDEIGPDRVALYGVTQPSARADAAKIREASAALKIHVPVLLDDGGRLGFELGVLRVPSIAILDTEGRLRLTNGGSLQQTLEYKMDLSDAVRRVATTGRLGTYGVLPTYYPAVEMAGKKCPDFTATEMGKSAPRKWSEILSPDRVNILIFWSVDCPHCRKALPEINTFAREHANKFNIVTVARVDNDAVKTKTEEYCKTQGLVMPVLLDDGGRIASQYLVTSTPTIFVVRPDDVVDSVMLTGEANFVQAFEAKESLLATPSKS